jgi:hypothetical protein
LLRESHFRQNEIDQARDMFDLRGLMRTALQANSDLEMIEVLQVGQDEMPEAIKTLQRALEREMEKENADGVVALPTASGEAVTTIVDKETVWDRMERVGGCGPMTSESSAVEHRA